MKRLDADEILDIDTYETIREDYRARIIAHKHDRRVGIGDKVTLVFEDRETLRYQIQEMTRIEQIREPSKVAQEIAVYNELVPDAGELSATLFIEIPDLERVKIELDQLLGLDEHVSLVVGEAGADLPVSRLRASFDEKQMEEDRISAVQYIRFRLNAEQCDAFARAATISIDHPNYTAETTLGSEARLSLLNDLRGEAPRLLDPNAIPRAETPQDVVLVQTARVRAYRPARPTAPDHIVVEPLQRVASLLDADAELAAELMEVAKRMARHIADRANGCRIATEIRQEGDAQLRWHLSAI